jgi:hypothetical protein
VPLVPFHPELEQDEFRDLHRASRWIFLVLVSKARRRGGVVPLPPRHGGDAMRLAKLLDARVDGSARGRAERREVETALRELSAPILGGDPPLVRLEGEGDDRLVRIVEWERWGVRRDDSSERVRRWRERRQETTPGSDITPGGSCPTAPGSSDRRTDPEPHDHTSKYLEHAGDVEPVTSLRNDPVTKRVTLLARARAVTRRPSLEINGSGSLSDRSLKIRELDLTSKHVAGSSRTGDADEPDHLVADESATCVVEGSIVEPGPTPEDGDPVSRRALGARTSFGAPTPPSARPDPCDAPEGTPSAGGGPGREGPDPGDPAPPLPGLGVDAPEDAEARAARVRRDEVDRILAYWVARPYHRGAVKVTKRRRDLVDRRLRGGWTARELCEAVAGAELDDWLMGRRDGSPGYREIETILGKDGTIERLIRLRRDRATGPARGGPGDASRPATGPRPLPRPGRELPPGAPDPAEGRPASAEDVRRAMAAMRAVGRGAAPATARDGAEDGSIGGVSRDR